MSWVSSSCPGQKNQPRQRTDGERGGIDGSSIAGNQPAIALALANQEIIDGIDSAITAPVADFVMLATLFTCRRSGSMLAAVTRWRRDSLSRRRQRTAVSAIMPIESALGVTILVSPLAIIRAFSKHMPTRYIIAMPITLIAIWVSRQTP